MAQATGVADRASIVQRDMQDAIGRFRPENARTLATFEQGTRKKTGRMAGLQIGYWKDRAHGQTWYNPNVGDTSFKKSIKQTMGAMYAGVVYRNMNFYMEAHVMKDMARGFIPDSYIAERRRRIATHMMKKNWAAIGDGRGAVAVIASADAGGLITTTFDNVARGRSKGSYRLSITDTTDPLYYDAVNPTTHAVVATFYVSSKPTTVQAQAAGFTVGAAAALNVAGLLIVESGSYNREMIGIGGHISEASRIYQGADTAVDSFLKNPSIDAGNSALTPTMVYSAKQIMATRQNSGGGGEGYICHLTPGNYSSLAKFGYTFRSYEASGGKANKTYGLPDTYEDGDTMFVPDADYEDGFVDLRQKSAFFEYVQKEFGLKTVSDGQTRHEWVGTYQAGSTNEYENYNEAVNIVWDGRGANGDGADGGSPAASVFIKNITIPSENQVAYGI